MLYLGYSVEGRMHDKRMVDEAQLCFAPGSLLWKDAGYQGFIPKNVLCFAPHKQPRNGKLTKEQKAENSLIASVRMAVEHAIGGVKRCRIVKDTIRLYDYHLRDKVVAVCTALHNFRLAKRKPYQINPALAFCPI